jgi:hypothetical protein
LQNGVVTAAQIVGGLPNGSSASTEFSQNPFSGGDVVTVNNVEGTLCIYFSGTPGTWSSVPSFQTPIPKTLGGSVPPSAGPSNRADPAPMVATMNVGCPNAQCGEPIDASTGNKSQAETDFVGGLNTQLSLTRYYNSQDGTTGGLGVGWHSTYHRGLAFADNVVVVTRADGRADTFQLNNGVWMTDSDVTSVLAPAPTSGPQTGWTLTLADDSIESYTMNG